MALPDFSMRQLLEAGVHYGHQTQRWNPRMAEYIYGDRNGIHIIDLTQTVAWKNGIVKKLNQGVSGLLKRAKVNVIKGWATFSDAKTCSVKTKSGAVTIHAEYVILATGSEATPLPHDVVEQRRAHLERVHHRGAVHLHEHVVDQAVGPLPGGDGVEL